MEKKVVLGKFRVIYTGSPVFPCWLTGLVRHLAALAHRSFTGNVESFCGIPRLSFTPGLSLGTPMPHAHLVRKDLRL